VLTFPTLDAPHVNLSEVCEAFGSELCGANCVLLLQVVLNRLSVAPHGQFISAGMMEHVRVDGKANVDDSRVAIVNRKETTRSCTNVLISLDVRVRQLDVKGLSLTQSLSASC